MDLTNFVAPQNLDEALVDLHSELEQVERAICALEGLGRPIVRPTTSRRGSVTSPKELTAVPSPCDDRTRHCSARHSQYPRSR